MIVIVEGVDRVGKTTLCNMLQSVGFEYFKDQWVIGGEVRLSQEKMFSVGKLDTTIALLRQLHQRGINVVVDRLHITEWVYGKLSRGYEPDPVHMNAIDRALAALNPTLVYVKPEDIEASSKQHGKNLEAHEREMYKVVSSSAIKSKIYTSFSRLKDAVEEIIEGMYKYDVYLASPFFNDEQVEREEHVKKALRKAGLTVFSPKENCYLPPTASETARDAVFKQNCDAIKACKAVFAITDGKDIGTIWEAGYAYGIGTPVIYYAETLGKRGFNLMLAQSGKKVYLDRKELEDGNALKEAIFAQRKHFEGVIE